MGVVYKARHLGLNRLVALKMISAGAQATLEQRARFHLEAEALASLQHPHIVQVYEVGEHEHRPYLALEFVDGSSLDARRAGNPQVPRQAAQLVETLARAMHCAHQRGIIHRDLKPANVLLDRDGMPKITDFGLAKRLGDESSRTHTGVVMGTPSYMAPEQAAGKIKEIGPLADVYALGAILYDLLTGRPPFAGTTVLETLLQVQFVEPVAPTRLRPKIPRDLETICLKCLQKEPHQRYASAADLAEDLRRFVAGEPIRARPVGRWERLRKWVRRRPAVAALIGVIALAVVGLPVGLTWHTVRLSAERDYAERNLRRALEAVQQMLTEVGEKQLADEPRMEEKRRALLAKALHFYQDFLKEKRTDPALRKETALAHQRLGDVLRLLEQYDAAKEAYSQARILLSQLAADYPSEPEYRQELAYGANFLGEIYRLTSRPREARAAYQTALQLQQQLVAEYPTRLGYQQDLARTYYNLAILLREDNHLEDAEKALTEAITLLEDLVAKAPHEPAYLQHLARSYVNLGPVLRATRRPRQARQRYDQARAVLEKLTDQDPDNPDYRHELGVCLLNRGNLLTGIDPKQAEEAFAAALKRLQPLTRDFPRVPLFRKDLGNAFNSLAGCLVQKQDSCGFLRAFDTTIFAVGSLLVHRRDRAAAREAWMQARDLFAKLAAERRDVPAHRGDLGMVCGNLGWLLAQQGDWKAARPELEEAVACLEDALKPPNARHPDYLSALRGAYQTLAETLLQLQDPDAAAEAAAALPGVFPDRGLDYYYAACFLARCVPLGKEPTLRQRYTDQAVDMLRLAVARGVAKAARLPEIEENNLKPLRPDVVSALLAELHGKPTTDPKSPPR
jgi:tetratricopeptide (TPR) repeat protein